MVRLDWCGLPVVSTSDLQSQTIPALWQLFSLFSHFKAASSAAFFAEWALLRVFVAACQRCRTFLSLAMIMPAPPFLLPSVVEPSVQIWRSP